MFRKLKTKWVANARKEILDPNYCIRRYFMYKIMALQCEEDSYNEKLSVDFRKECHRQYQICIKRASWYFDRHLAFDKMYWS